MRSLSAALFAAHIIFSVPAIAAEPPPPAAKETPQDNQGPVLLSMPKPQYPFELRRQRIQGEVFIEFTIDIGGNVRDAKVISATHKDFQTPALKAVEQAKFKPAMKGGDPVPVRMKLPIVFQL